MNAALTRIGVIDAVLSALGPTDCIVAGLGYIARDTYAATAHLRDRVFCCMGSMGSVTPMALGLTLSRPAVRVVALEGDGSLLMNLGTLATLRRYGSGRVALVVFDNGCYESTGGQCARAQDIAIEDFSRAAGLITSVATCPEEVEEFVRSTDGSRAHVLVAKVVCASATGRIAEGPEIMAERFSIWLNRQ